jgi:hypothetical protein
VDVIIVLDKSPKTYLHEASQVGRLALVPAFEREARIDEPHAAGRPVLLLGRRTSPSALPLPEPQNTSSIKEWPN